MALRWTLPVLFGPAVAWLVVVAGTTTATLLDDAAWGPPDRARAEVVGAEDCRGCHASQWSSWHDSYHRTMTQVAPTGVLAPFAGESLVALGFVATMSRDGDGRPRIRIVDEHQAVLLDHVVELAVGSHRYQQYVARMDRGGGDGELWRLPVAWHVAEARWIHLNGAFLAPDGRAGDRDDYLRHLARYNDNCIFCHNTEPVPGLDDAGHWNSEVGQWGIACEACHGAASLHVGRQASVARRVWSVVGHDGSITDPGDLIVDRSNEICGRCHGQRIGRDIAEILAHGDGFVPGEALDEVSRPIFRDSTVEGGEHFASRFWPDGTPRLSAHEFQGVLLSPCTDLSCGDCHDMHGQTPAMQLRRDWDPVGTCLGCHDGAALGGAEQAGGHGGHGAAATCVDCHLPRTAYGLLEGIISHRITSPAPAELVGRHDAPDACTQCHVDRSRAWAVAALPGLGLGGGLAPAAVTAREDPRESWASRVVLDLHGGDPIQRALATHALARPGVPVDAHQRLSWIIDGMADDYAAVRWMAWRGAKALATVVGDTGLGGELEAFDPGAAIEQRIMGWQRLRARLGPGPFSGRPDRQAALESSREAAAIWIGE